MMSDMLWDILYVAWPPFVLWLLLKFAPSTFTRFVQKEIDRRSDMKLERIKGEIQGSYSTLKTSVDILTAQNSSISVHAVEATKALWANMMNMRNDFGAIITFDSVILAEEAEAAFAKSDKSGKMLDFVRQFDTNAKHIAITQNNFVSDAESNRLFCGDRLWLIFYVYRALLGRFSLLITRSFSSSKYNDWRKDDPGKSMLQSVITKSDVDTFFSSPNAGLHNIFGKLEAEFIHEATRVMTGSKAIAERLADTQALMQLENAKVAASK